MLLAVAAGAGAAAAVAPAAVVDVCVRFPHSCACFVKSSGCPTATITLVLSATIMITIIAAVTFSAASSFAPPTPAFSLANLDTDLARK